MATPRVVRKVKVENEWQFLPVAKHENKLDWTHVVHRGVPMVSTSGTFYLDYREAGKRVRRAIGDHPRDAKTALALQSSVISLRQTGMTVEDAPQVQVYRPVSGPRIADLIADYVKNPPLKLRVKSRYKYNNALLSFAKWTKKTHLSQLAREDVNGFMSYLVESECLDASTALDKGHVIHAVMNDLGADIKMKRGDWPRVTDKDVTLYEPDVLKKLFAAASRYEFVLFQTFLMTGFRDQEIGFLSWADFNPRTSTLKVSKKKELGFDPKNYQERQIPIPSLLVTLLKEHRKNQDGDEFLIFPTSRHNEMQGKPGGQRDRHMLDTLKKLAMRAGLNCGRCTGSWQNKLTTCEKSPICKEFGLHKFRHTYATTMLRDGVDIVSLQTLLGHRDLDSTKKYLRSLSPAAMLAKINMTSISTAFWTAP